MAFETPEILRVFILAPHVVSTDEEEDLTAEQKLVSDIIKANGLSPYKLENAQTNEYWINQSIHAKEDLNYIYENFIVPTNDKELLDLLKTKIRLSGNLFRVQITMHL